ncbi:WG repeat-containing protein [Reichenbachiella agarivorans]|uniref:WG repeat-containing protein n=1 Tax=Reichenbachiella agarivorans TaxID=2979464 RepID=A0ABY6CK99_9BACT|nr:WG repeat-containing protein [Reichenbachiella agarivorans]UXP30951.1 WG repeat-containing protein [Reichenbachiella agarivorans]
MNKVRYISLLLILFVHMVHADRSKQALRAIEKEDYDKAKEYLQRSYDKDSLNPLVSYSYAKLYVAQTYEGQDLDIANDYILHAFLLLPNRTEAHTNEIEKADLTLQSFDQLKDEIDSLAYMRADTLHDVAQLEHFILHHGTAAQVPAAIAQRDSIRFKEAEVDGTWQAYQAFMNAYPDANQFPIAKIRFDKLIYESTLFSDKLSELEEFLVKYPQTPFRGKIEKRIYDKKVAGLQEEDILSFIHTYHNDQLIRRALGLLYHSVGIKKDKLKNYNQQVYKQFMDSVAYLEQLNAAVLFPMYLDHQYSFYGLAGDEFLKGPYDEISRKYLCGNVTEEILEVKQNGEQLLLNRAGTVIYQGQLDGYEDLGAGVLALTLDSQVGAITMTGDVILPIEYEEIKVLDGHLISFREKGKIGLAGITGKVFLEPAYDDIFLEGGFWVVELDGVFGVTNLREILSDEKEIAIKYEEVELINQDYIVGYTEELESLISADLKVVSPDSTLSINTMHAIWVFRTPEGYRVYDKEKASSEEAIYHDVLQNDDWLGLRKYGKWSVYSQNIESEPILNVDSLKLLGDDIAIVFMGSQGMAIFPNRQVVNVNKGEYLQALSSSRRTLTHYLVIKRGEELELYRDGKLQFRSAYDELGFISEGFFSVKKDGKYGAVDEKGRLIMKVRYNAIGEAKKGIADVLVDGKFGAFNFDDKVLLRTNYFEKLKPYNDNILVVKEENGYGLLDRMNQEWVRGSYEKIEYWSDSTFLGRKNGKWELRAIYTDEVLIGDIDLFQYLSNSQDKKVIEISVNSLYGVYHSERGLIIPAEYNDIYNLGSAEQNLYYAEKAFPEADYYVVVYYDDRGEKIKSEAYRSDEYESIVCDE